MKVYGGEIKQEKLARITAFKIIPFLKKTIESIPDGLIELITYHSKILTGVKGQFIEEAGPAEEGHLLFFDSGIAQNFYYDAVRRKYITTLISRKHEVIIDVNSFLNQEDRIGNIQMLEEGTVLSIAYSGLKILLASYPILHITQWQLQAEREKQHVYYQHLLKLTLNERIEIYLDDNPGIAARINNEYIASYLGTSRARFSTAYAKYRNAKQTSL